MSYELIESCRRVLAADADVKAIVDTRIFPSFLPLNRDGSAPIPAIVISTSSGNDQDRAPKRDRKDTILQLDYIGDEQSKKELWVVHRRAIKALSARSITEASVALHGTEEIDIKVGLFKLSSEEDNLYDEETNTLRVRAQFSVKFHRTTHVPVGP